jgi:hypothetical protein
MNTLREEHAAFITEGLSITASSRNSRLIPSLSRVISCKVSENRDFITLYLAGQHAHQLLLDIKQSGSLAVVFSRPSSHQTIQIKGLNAKQLEVEPTDLAGIYRSTQAFCDDLQSIAYNPEIGRALHGCSEEQIVAIGFTPAMVFEQSPGLKAGHPLEFSQ